MKSTLTHFTFNTNLDDLLLNLKKLDPYAIWQTSGQKNTSQGVTTHSPSTLCCVGLTPAKVFSFKEDLLHVQEGTRRMEIKMSFVHALTLVKNEAKHFSSAELSCFSGGLFGTISYDAGRHLETIRGIKDIADVPDFYFMLFDQILVIDSEKKKITLVQNSNPKMPSQQERFAETNTHVKEVLCTIPGNINFKRECEPCAFDLRFSKSVFSEKVNQALEYIRAGDIFQVVLSNKLNLNFAPCPFLAYCYLRNINPSPYHFLIRINDSYAVGASPEVFLRAKTLHSGETKLLTRPVAGTYPKGIDEKDIQQKVLNLRKDSKEKAEHIMLVDHMRNDLGKVSKIGSVRVEDLFSIETYTHIHHLVSGVSGILKKEENLMSAIAACFPIATLTGTPKIRAMEIIAELEEDGRGLFGGSICAIGFDGSLDSTVAIRYAQIDTEKTTIRAGAGIVADSKPENEFEECLRKAHAVVNACSFAHDSFN